MTIQEAAKKLNEELLSDNKEEIRKLKEKVDTLEKVIVNLIKRLDYIEVNIND
jgi:hypothetical protein